MPMPNQTPPEQSPAISYFTDGVHRIWSHKPRTNNDNSLARLADDLYIRGVRRISGNIIGDESYFRGEPLGDGWQWNDIQWYFGAEASALSINGNEVGVNIMPPDKTGAPPLVNVSTSDGYVTVQNGMIPVNRGGADDGRNQPGSLEQ